jgi:hypothetical protein
MRYDGDGRKSLKLLEIQAARKLAEIHRMIAPGLTAPVGLEDLQRVSQSHMAELSPVDREKLKSKAIVVFAQLERLMIEMSHHLADIGEELRKVNHQSRAVSAYSQSARLGRRHLAAL